MFIACRNENFNFKNLSVKCRSLLSVCHQLPPQMPSVSRRATCLDLELSEFSICDKCLAFSTSTRRRPEGVKPKCLQPWFFNIKPTTTFPKKEKKRIAREELESKGYTFGEELNTTEASTLSRHYFKPALTSEKLKHVNKETVETGQVQAFKNVPNELNVVNPSGNNINACTHLARQIPPPPKKNQPLNSPQIPATHTVVHRSHL